MPTLVSCCTHVLLTFDTQASTLCVVADIEVGVQTDMTQGSVVQESDMKTGSMKLEDRLARLRSRLMAAVYEVQAVLMDPGMISAVTVVEVQQSSYTVGPKSRYEGPKLTAVPVKPAMSETCADLSGADYHNF